MPIQQHQSVITPSSFQIRMLSSSISHPFVGLHQLRLPTLRPSSSSSSSSSTLTAYTSGSFLLSKLATIQVDTDPGNNHVSLIQYIQTRSMGSKKGSTNQKNKAKQKSMKKKQLVAAQQQKLARQAKSAAASNTTSVSTDDDQSGGGGGGGEEHATGSNKNAPAEQHKEWVEFQKSIAVDGFETGQTVSLIDTNKKGRSGGKMASKKRLTKRDEMAAKIKERQRLAGGGGGEFPPMRYSDEETERLLIQAYSAIPPRMGKRGTLQLKRQKRRWHLVKEIHRKYKTHIMNHHAVSMKKRSQKIKQIVEFLKIAPSIVQQDKEYQERVRERYMNMISDAEAMSSASSTNVVNSNIE
jgi:hypothetical protein